MRGCRVRSCHMRSLLLSLILSLSLPVSVLAADGKAVSYKSGDETVSGILYTPTGKGPFPALIVIHEYWGLNDWVKQQAEKLADQGYVARDMSRWRSICIAAKLPTIPTWRTN
jgi:carboxymethylenebutenolidase